MPKPMLKQLQAQQQEITVLSAAAKAQQKQCVRQMDKLQEHRLLRKKRSKEYMQVMCSLDAGGRVHNQQKVKMIIDTIRSEFPDLEISSIMLGIVAVCYLGVPYEVHTLDITEQIIEHYQGGQALPGGLEKARTIAMRGGYEFIEVYVDCCRAVSANGAVVVIF